MPVFQPLERLLVRYVRDPRLWHERILLRRVQDNWWMVASPERDVYLLLVESPPLMGILQYSAPLLPGDVDELECYRGEDTAGGAFSELEIAALARDSEAARRLRLGNVFSAHRAIFARSSPMSLLKNASS